MKNTSKQLSKRKRTGATAEPAPNRHLLGEQMTADIQRVMQGHEFASVEEANAFLAALFGNGMQQALRHLPPPSSRTQAQQIAFDAMEARTERQARKLARQALALDPDCVDAIVLLADLDARSPEELMAGLEKAVQAGERSLGPAFFAKNKGYFWGLLETRPYMRARMDLAQVLLSTGRAEEAVHHFEALLELNPNDNQGVHHVLLGCYPSRGNLAGAHRLLHDYQADSTAIFAWGRTLERFLAAICLARRWGSDEEAIICLAYLSGAWADHPLATSWLWEQLGFRRPQASPQQNRPF
jgi:tetratricopeptide (TPR) repeat protein